MLFQTTSAHEELRAKIRSFAEEEIKPLAFLMDQNNEFPEEAVKKLGKLGWMGIPYPKEYGGAGLDALSYAIAVEELARVDGGTGVILSAHVSLGSWPIFAYGTEEQKKKYLVPLAKGEKIGAFGLTETNAGSDAGGTETTALDKGDYYLLNGGKIFITNAPKADTYVVFAVTTPDIGTRGISAFIVEKGWKGFEFGDHYDKMGIRCLPGKLPCKAGFHTSGTDIRPDKSYLRSGSVSALQAWYPASKNCSPPFSRPAYATIPAAPLPPAVKPPRVHLTALPRLRPHRSDGFYFYRSGSVPVHTAIPPEIPQGSAQTTGSAAHNLCPHGVP